MGEFLGGGEMGEFWARKGQEGGKLAPKAPKTGEILGRPGMLSSSTSSIPLSCWRSTHILENPPPPPCSKMHKNKGGGGVSQGFGVVWKFH